MPLWAFPTPPRGHKAPTQEKGENMNTFSGTASYVCPTVNNTEEEVKGREQWG